MFDGLFKPKFYTKCKSLVKLTKTRVDAVKRKKNAVCKYLKNDIADLLKNHLDYNAYGRIEGLLEEKKRLCCYELLEQFCSCVGTNVSLLQKASGCPQECREAISSLIYAAARVSEVPELRDLRNLFAARYGGSLEQFVNQELVEKFKVEPPSKEMKLQLMHEIAREYSIEWDSKSLEQKLYTPPPAERTLQAEGNQGSAEDAAVDTGQTRAKTKKETCEDKSGPAAKANSLTYHEKAKIMYKEEESTKTRESSVGGLEDDEQEGTPLYYRFVPAPYMKPTIEKSESLPKSESSADDSESKPKPRSVRRRFAKPPPDEQNERRDEESLYPLKPPPASSMMNLRAESMEKATTTRLNRRTISWQPAASNDVDGYGDGEGRRFQLPDFDEVAARLHALRPK